MTGQNGIVVVVNGVPDEAQNVKELIEFMDVPLVCTATPANWRTLVGDRCLDAVFVGPHLSDRDFRHVLDDIGEFAANVPIVVLRDAKT